MCCFCVNLSVLLLPVLFRLPSCRASELPFWNEYDNIQDDFNYEEYDVKMEAPLNTSGRYTLYNGSLVEETNDIHWKTVRTAESKCPKDDTCARKCCPTKWDYDLSNNNCVRKEKEYYFTGPLYYEHHENFFYDTRSYVALNAFEDAEHFTILNGIITCQPDSGEVKIQATEISQYFRLNEKGMLDVEISSTIAPILTLGTNKYCLDVFIADDGSASKNALICHVPDSDLDNHYLLSGICMLVTCFLVLLRVVVFAWVPELQTLHGMILMAYLISFLVGFLLLGLEQFLMMKHIIGKSICISLTLVIHFFTLSAYFWRNVMCYDIWWTFSGIRAMYSRGASSRKRFRLYCAYAFGGPVILTIVLASIEFSDLPIENPLTPRIRINCFLIGYGRLLYLLGPLMILFVMNIIFFTLTSLKIWAIKKQTATILQTKDSCAQRPDIHQFTLYAKLFGSMAFLEINLILEVVAILRSDYIDILHISDAFNVLVPFIIIVNFLCRKQTWTMINKRYRQMRGLPLSPAQSTVPITIVQSSQEDSNSVITYL